jgi:hypothetical protein
MKNLIKITAILFVMFLIPTATKAQDQRNKIVLTVNNGGKNITTDLGSVNYAITRYDTSYNDTSVTTTGTAPAPTGSFYLSMTANNVSTDLLKLMAKKGSKFNGTITITDSYGRNPVREIKFANASLESYSDQFSTMSYGEDYPVAAITLLCTSLTLNGVVLE